MLPWPCSLPRQHACPSSGLPPVKTGSDEICPSVLVYVFGNVCLFISDNIKMILSPSLVSTGWKLEQW
ncbi:hypothetical protein PAXRUDRAFT_697336 [Paxillus rubicundulus Ve08.2h10]|uniref:Uncharacterized protein n=1 Tax=Paxillus rubicundulus Ve08.2h10 TaxID=930991 RepID=A0A0D0DI31_9AGAM|nr:hypothetical protein PAXRUDRAFT_697336 [Paxillus rubicundulus Ve08.2h10]